MILKNVADVIQNYMGLRDNQIWLRNEKYIVPNDVDFYITIGFLTDKVRGTKLENFVSNQITTIETTVPFYVKANPVGGYYASASFLDSDFNNVIIEAVEIGPAGNFNVDITDPWASVSAFIGYWNGANPTKLIRLVSDFDLPILPQALTLTGGVEPVWGSITTSDTTVMAPVVTEFYNETVITNKYAILTIDFYGKTFDVFDRKDEIIQAFNSSYSLEAQAKNLFYVAKHPLNMINVSVKEGSAILYRYKVDVAVMYATYKSKQLTNNTFDFYDSFTKEVIHG